jgi:hypothetical protein
MTLQYSFHIGAAIIIVNLHQACTTIGYAVK